MNRVTHDILDAGRYRGRFFAGRCASGRRRPTGRQVARAGRVLTGSCLLSCSLFLHASAAPGVIFDTDFNTDCDDDNALVVLHALADNNECVIRGIICSDPDARIEDIRAINQMYGRGDIPVGLFNHNGGGDIHNATALYRRALGESADNDVIIVTVGYLSCMEKLLRSGGDSLSPKSGIDLVREKVITWSCMGGDYPEGNEWNFRHYSAAAAYSVAHWPGAVVFNGYSVGEDIRSGGCDQRCRRSSWDPCAVLAGVRDPADYWELHTSGFNDVADDGSNVWKETPDKDHAYCIDESKWTNRQLVDLLNDLMCAPPTAARGQGRMGPPRSSASRPPSILTPDFTGSGVLRLEWTRGRPAVHRYRCDGRLSNGRVTRSGMFIQIPTAE